MALAFAIDARAGADREESQAGIRRRAMTRYASPDRFAIARSGGFDTPLAAFALAAARASIVRLYQQSDDVAAVSDWCRADAGPLIHARVADIHTADAARGGAGARRAAAEYYRVGIRPSHVRVEHLPRIRFPSSLECVAVRLLIPSSTTWGQATL
jgi:hypothetical protein